MPITKSALKKQRVDKKRTKVNAPIKTRAKKAVKVARAEKSQEALNSMFSALDKAVSKKLMPKNRVARLKSRISKAVSKKTK